MEQENNPPEGKKIKKNISKKTLRIVFYTAGIIALLIVVTAIGAIIFLQKNIPSEKNTLPQFQTSQEDLLPLERQNSIQEKDREEYRSNTDNTLPRAAIIIDDLGWNKKVAQSLFALNVPLSLAIIPNLLYSRVIAEEANRRGRDILLHLPMEPHNYPEINPGEGTLLHTMTQEEILNQLEEHINSLPFVDGVNNHMGSRLTEHEYIMRLILERVKEKNLFFIDSLTSNKSVGYSIAKELGLRTAQRTIFIDNNEEVEYIKSQLFRLIRIAKKTGTAIGIGHPYKETIKALKAMIEIFHDEGVIIVPVSELLG